MNSEELARLTREFKKKGGTVTKAKQNQSGLGITMVGTVKSITEHNLTGHEPYTKVKVKLENGHSIITKIFKKNHGLVENGKCTVEGRVPSKTMSKSNRNKGICSIGKVSPA